MLKKIERRPLKLPNLAERRERMLASRALRLKKQKLGDPAPLRDDATAPVAEVEGVVGLNGAIAGIEAERKKKNKLDGAELDKWQKNRKRVREIRIRQADGGNCYFVVVCDTGGQTTALLEFMKSKHMIDRQGDLFVDGRLLAEAIGCKLPQPEYQMTTSVTLARGETKAMAKIPKGYARQQA